MSGADFHTLIVVAALIERDGRLLIARRPEGVSSAGYWEFPGGKAEPGEEPRDALVRECEEELGIGVEAGSIYETVYTKNEQRGILLLFYTARILRGEPQSLEANEFAWATPDEMDEYELLPADRPLVEKFRRAFPQFERSL